MRVIRVFPRRTRCTPDDDMAFVGAPTLFAPEADAVHISVAFTYDILEAERLAYAWSAVAPVTIGGPAVGMRGEAFVAGQFIKRGYTITSRGCPNNCWFCSVPKRDGTTRPLSIVDGWNVLDDNLLACPLDHIRAVVAMLSRQTRPAEFTGGLEAARLTHDVMGLLTSIRVKRAYFAFDTPDDEEPLRAVVPMLDEAGWLRRHKAMCYVLIGWPKDTMDAATERLELVRSLGLGPFAMLWRNQRGEVNDEWRRFQRRWVRPQIVWSRPLDMPNMLRSALPSNSHERSSAPREERHDGQ